jgi:hypothetical protein
MAKTTKKDIDIIDKSSESIDYNKLRLDVLKDLIEGRGIECKQTKEEMIKYLRMDDEDKYIRPITYEKQPENKFMVGIDIRDQIHLIEMGKLVEKGHSQRIKLYSNNRVYYISNQKLI